MITLHPEALVKAHSLIHLGTLLCIFPLNMFRRVVEVTEGLVRNELFASDLDDLMWLSSILLTRSEINNMLKDDIKELSMYLFLKVREYAEIKKSCGRQMHESYP